MSIDAAIAVTRFGMGARKGELNSAASDPRGWVLEQLANPANAQIKDASLPNTKQAVEATLAHFQKRRDLQKQAKQSGDKKALQMHNRTHRQAFVKEVAARNLHAARTPYGFMERWARFWSNHFTVSVRKPELLRIVGPHERDAIRAFAFGRFEDLLTKAVLHPAMLIYLDNQKSFGPNTPIAMRRKLGLNENLAREILELHTVGVEGGYGQKDVEEFARALTGWTVGSPKLRSRKIGETVFEERLHEPGDRTVLGVTYREAGAVQALAILKELARHPATANHIATKLARHFIADDVSRRSIKALKRAFEETDGDLSEVAKTLISLEDAWQPAPRKFKTPEEMLISSARLLGVQPVYGRGARRVYQSLGQSPFTAPSPDGWSDEAAAWAGPDAIKKRLEWANRTARLSAPNHVPLDFLADAVGALASERTRSAIALAESRQQGLTLALMSPEFQRR